MAQAKPQSLSRRDFVRQVSLFTAASAALGPALTGRATDRPANRRMTIDLVGGAIGVSGGQMEQIELAARYGFESVGADPAYLARLDADKIAELKALMESKHLAFGAAGLPVDFRQDETKFRDGMKGLPELAAGLQRAGVGRVSTWLTPGSRQITYLQNFRQHATRLREVAGVLKDHGLRLGLEYVGPKTSWTAQRFPFIHTMAEMKELIGEVGTGNVGFLLDSWHWWHAGETSADILSLRASDVIAVDLNDAPAGVQKDQMPDGRRELPCATNVIPVGEFLNALNRIEYDGPVRAEPFNQALNEMDNDAACAATVSALGKAFALLV
jgi:sugar phosphate isomerase/epimerase